MRMPRILAQSILTLLAMAANANAAEALYGFSANLSNGITVTGSVVVDSSNPGFTPGGTVEFTSGGVTDYRFEATNGATTELIDSRQIGSPNPQTIRMTFSSGTFPAVESWDFSLSNQSFLPFSSSLASLLIDDMVNSLP